MTSYRDRWKFSPPNAPHIFYRQRLLELFHENRDKQLLLIVGQAGQGKSTLVAKAVATSKRPAVWINLDPTDADPASFMTGIITAFEDRWKSLDFNPVANDLATPITPSKSLVIYFLWANAFWKIAPGSVQIVLDMLDQIPEDSPTYQLIDALVRTAPETVQFCLISRKRPPLRISRLKVDNQAYVVENEVLAFNPSETSRFLRQTHLPGLPDDVAGSIHTYTEGWLVGILTIAHWLSGKQRNLRAADIKELLGRSVPEEIFSYFAEEVFNGFDPADQQLLVQTAFLEVLEPSLVDKLLRRDDSHMTLRRLSENDLFIQQFTDTSGKPFFRCHQLFQRFLKFQHNNKISAPVQRRLCLQAADLYAAEGYAEKSLPYYLRAQRYAEAGKILAGIGVKLISGGQTEQLAGYLNSFPSGERQKSAWLLLFEAVLARFKQSPQALENMCRCREMFASHGEDAGLTMTLAYLIETAFLLGHCPIDMDRLLAESRALLAKDEGVTAGLKARLWLQIGFATIRGMGNFGEAFSACQTACMLAKTEGDTNLQCHSLSLSKLACAYLGEFDKADDLDRQIALLLPECSTEIKTFHLSSQCLLNIYRGRREEALADLQQFESEVEKYGFHHFQAWLTIYKCLLYPRVGRLAEAEKILSVWLQLCVEPTFRRAMALLFVGFCAYYRAAVVEGTAALEEAAAIFRKGPLRSEFQYFAARKGLGIAAYLRGEYSEADGILQEVLEYACAINSHTLIADAHLLIGLNKYAAQDPAAAFRHLRSAFDIITTRRLNRLVVTHEDDLACACLLALKLGVLEDLSWVRQLLAQNANAAIVRELEQEIQDTRHAGRKKVLEESLRATVHAQLPRLEIRTLNELSLRINGEPIPLSRWKGAGNQRFLAVLLAHGGRRVPKELIMDALWPDSPPPAAHSNFKSALHRLRKVLEPQKGRYHRSHYLHAHGNQLGLDPLLCRIDFEAFEQAARKALKSSNEAESNRLARQAAQIYQGPFVPDELYHPSIVSHRQHLNRIYLQTIELLARIAERNGDHQRALSYLEQWMSADPYSEAACRRLMRIFSRSGHPGRALRLYRTFETRLEKELQLKPDTETQALFHQIETGTNSRPKA